VSDPQTNSITINVVGLDNLGVDLSAFSIGTEGAASGNGSLQYNNTTGVFTYIPPDLSIYATVVRSDTTVTTGAGAITNIISITQADYDNIVTPDATTLYIITE
jgi:hypothetical protein